MANISTAERITSLIEAGCFNRETCAAIVRVVPPTAKSPWFHGMFRRDRGGESGVSPGVGTVRFRDESETEFGVKSTEVATGKYRLSRDGRSVYIKHFMHASDVDHQSFLEIVSDRYGAPFALYAREPRSFPIRVPFPSGWLMVQITIYRKRRLPTCGGPS